MSYTEKGRKKMADIVHVLSKQMYEDLLAKSKAPATNNNGAQEEAPLPPQIIMQREPSVIDKESSWDTIMAKTILLLPPNIKKRATKLLYFIQGHLEVNPLDLRVKYNDGATMGGNLADLLSYTFRAGVTARHVPVPADKDNWFELLASLNLPSYWLPETVGRKELKRALKRLIVPPPTSKKKKKTTK